jgi:hypothetical protein
MCRREELDETETGSFSTAAEMIGRPGPATREVRPVSMLVFGGDARWPRTSHGVKEKVT